MALRLHILVTEGGVPWRRYIIIISTRLHRWDIDPDELPMDRLWSMVGAEVGPRFLGLSG